MSYHDGDEDSALSDFFDRDEMNSEIKCCMNNPGNTIENGCNSLVSAKQ